MAEIVQIVIAVLLGAFALPFGLLPSIFLFRGLANGTDGSDATKRAYAWTLWLGLAAAWIAGAGLVHALLELAFG